MRFPRTWTSPSRAIFSKARRIERGFDRRGPWITRFQIDGHAYGGEIDLPGDSLIDQFSERMPAGSTVLELGSLEGGHSFALARHGYRVTGVEGRTENIGKARYVQGLLGDRQTRFVHANLEQTSLTSFGRFDCVLCAGLLYHLPRPWDLLNQLPDVAPRLFLRTHYAEQAVVEIEGLRGRWYREIGREDPLSGLSPQSFWLTLPSLLRVLEQGGFGRIELLGFPDNQYGPVVVLTAAINQPQVVS
jgi:SAM-dependent methyltransferase